jgi:hypothetical protein
VENRPVTARREDLHVTFWRIVRRATPVAVAALVFAAPALASHGGTSSGSSSGSSTTTTAVPTSGTLGVQGVVQSVSASAVSVRLLDGTPSSVPYDKKTEVLVNGKTGRITDVRPGFVLVASWKAGKQATMLRFVRPN